jgi:predicted Zn-dependent peptidase
MPGPLTALAVAVRAGSRRDGRHPGLAHMAEHMLFQGTRTFDQMALNRRAGDLGGEHDADTGYEDVTFHLEVLNEEVEDALGLLAEQLFRSTLPAERFAKERRVVIDEIRGRQEDPATYLHEHTWGRFFGGPLEHPVCGSIASLRRMTPVAVRRFVARHFVPANMVLAVVGGLSGRSLRRALTRTFPTHGPPAPANPPRPRRLRTGTLRLRRHALTQAYLVRLIAAPRDARRLLALALAVEIIGADPDARLFQEIRERLGLGYDVSAGVEQGHDWSIAVLAASAAREDARRLRETIERTCLEAARGFSSEEARAKKKVAVRLLRLARSPLDQALSHATRAIAGHPSLATSARLLGEVDQREVERAWRAALSAPTLTGLLTAG